MVRAAWTKEAFEERAYHLPIRRAVFVKTEEVARVALFLAVPESSCISEARGLRCIHSRVVVRDSDLGDGFVRNEDFRQRIDVPIEEQAHVVSAALALLRSRIGVGPSLCAERTGILGGTEGSNPSRSAIQSPSSRTSQRIARNPRACERLAMKHGPGERLRRALNGGMRQNLSASDFW
jgi:hypothetical protein